MRVLQIWGTKQLQFCPHTDTVTTSCKTAIGHFIIYIYVCASSTISESGKMPWGIAGGKNSYPKILGDIRHPEWFCISLGYTAHASLSSIQTAVTISLLVEIPFVVEFWMNPFRDFCSMERFNGKSTGNHGLPMKYESFQQFKFPLNQFIDYSYIPPYNGLFHI